MSSRNTATNTSRSPTPPSPINVYDRQARDRRLDNWLQTSAHPVQPPSHARDIPRSEILVQTHRLADADYNWLVAYLNSEIPFSSTSLSETVPKLQRAAVNSALISAVSEILFLTDQLDDRISIACTPSLKIRITKERMYRGRDRHWYFKPETICRWSDEEKVESLNAARQEIRWLKVECMSLEQFVWDRQAKFENDGFVDETSYVPGAR
jgi:hypothetical protein